MFTDTNLVLQAPVIFGAVTIFAFLSWWFIPEEKWLRRQQVKTAFEEADNTHNREEVDTTDGDQNNNGKQSSDEAAASHKGQPSNE